MGRQASNVDTEPNVPMGRPTSNVNVELDVPTGCPSGTTCDAGFNVSSGRAPSCTDTTQSANCKETKVDDNNSDMYNVTGVLEDNPVLLAEHVKQYDLPSAWDTDKTNLSLSDDLLTRAKNKLANK